MADKGTRVGKYLITGKIAEGGMGAIYKARHPTLNRDIILKRLTLRKSKSITERFKREAQLMIDFRDDRIVQVYDHFKEGNSYYIAMEYVAGISLADLIKKKRYIPNDVAILIFDEICKALKYAHDKGVIHRDIKPANILISNDGEIKLTDFGIARSAEGGEKEEGLTTDGMTLGTPAYMSPEQISDSKNVDKRADIYSMGVVLYEMVTGKCPFPGSFTPEAIAQIQKGEYLPPKRINPRIAPVIRKIIKKAMHRKVKRRYKDLRYIIAILKRYSRKYKDRSAINNTIKNYLLGKEIHTTDGHGFSFKDILKKLVDVSVLMVSSNFARIIVVFVLLASAIAAGGFYLYLEGMHYEYLMADDFGALKVIVEIEKKHKMLKDKFIDINLYRLKDNRYSRVKDPAIKFNREAPGTSRGNYVLESEKIYLPAANYRLIAHVENELYQRDFNLKPRIEQRTNKDSFECMVIPIEVKGTPPLPVKLYYTVNDISTGKNITYGTDLYVYYRRWYKWPDLIKDKRFNDIFVTGRTYKFKFIHEGYYTEYLAIALKPFQTVLTIDTEMVPVPGSLYYRANESGIDFLVNNSDYYTSGGKSRNFKKIDPAATKFNRLRLSPGQYFITAKVSDGISKTAEVTIESGKSVKIYIDYNSSTEKIDLNIR